MSTNTKYVRIEYTIRPDVDLDEVKREITDFIAAIGAHHAEHRYTSFQLEEDPRRFIHIGELVADAMPPLQAQPFFRSFADFLRARCIRGPEATLCLAKTQFICIFNNFARYSPHHYFPDQNSLLA